MLAHLMIGITIGLVAAVTMAFSGAGVVGVILTYSFVGAAGLMGSAMLTMARHDALEAQL